MRSPTAWNLVLAVLLAGMTGCATGASRHYVYAFAPEKATTGAIEITLAYDDSVHKRQNLFSSEERLLMFKVNLRNNTDRVIRTSGCKIVFDYGGTPYEALSKAQILGWLKDTQTPSEQVIRDVSGRNLFNEEMEIYPGYASSAYVCFGVSPDLAVDGQIKMFDVPKDVLEDGAVKSKGNLNYRVTRTEIAEANNTGGTRS